jgi:hypothetical protein
MLTLRKLKQVGLGGTGGLMSSLEEQFLERLKDAIDYNGITRTDLARALGVKLSGVSNFVNGYKSFKKMETRKEYFQKSLSFLISKNIPKPDQDALIELYNQQFDDHFVQTEVFSIKVTNGAIFGDQAIVNALFEILIGLSKRQLGAAEKEAKSKPRVCFVVRRIGMFSPHEYQRLRQLTKALIVKGFEFEYIFQSSTGRFVVSNELGRFATVMFDHRDRLRIYRYPPGENNAYRDVNEFLVVPGLAGLLLFSADGESPTHALRWDESNPNKELKLLTTVFDELKLRSTAVFRPYSTARDSQEVNDFGARELEFLHELYADECQPAFRLSILHGLPQFSRGGAFFENPTAQNDLKNYFSFSSEQLQAYLNLQEMRMRHFLEHIKTLEYLEIVSALSFEALTWTPVRAGKKHFFGHAYQKADRDGKLERLTNWRKVVEDQSNKYRLLIVPKEAWDLELMPPATWDVSNVEVPEQIFIELHGQVLNGDINKFNRVIVDPSLTAHMRKNVLSFWDEHSKFSDLNYVLNVFDQTIKVL